MTDIVSIYYKGVGTDIIHEFEIYLNKIHTFSIELYVSSSILFYNTITEVILKIIQIVIVPN